MKRASLQQLVRVWKARAYEARAARQIFADLFYSGVVDELSRVLEGEEPPEEPAVVNVRVAGELTRREIEAHAALLLTPVLSALAKAGIVVSLVAAPARDPSDGKAVVCTSTHNVEQMRQMFEQAAARLRDGKHFTLEKS